LEEAKNTIKKQQIEKENGLKDDRKSLISRESNKRKLEKELDLFKNDQCPTCHADLKSDFHLGLKEKLEKVKSENEEELKGVRDRVSAVEKEITEIRNKETKVISKISDLNSKIQSFKSDLLDLAKKMDKGEHGEFQSLIEEFKAKERTKTSKKTELTSEEHFYGVLETMLGDDGIKNMAMKMILPSLNANISQMTRTLGIPFNISFDNKFDSVITHLGEEVNPKTLSTGEKKKADFAIIIALIKMMKMRFPSLNVLFLDEIFISVDSDGIYHILGIIHETIKEAKINAFVINHTILPSELFDKKISSLKDN
jgi:DNA repair exonuclease SbcCD ATPase subunit